MHPPSPPICADCGYDLSGTPIVNHQLTCPECGGNRVWIPRWYEPRLSWRRAPLYLPGTLLAGLPGALLAGLIGGRDHGSIPYWLLLSSPPYVWLGCILIPWRPGVHAGVTVIGLSAVLAAILGGLACAALLLPGPVAALCVVPLALMYYVLPVPLGILWAYSVLDDTHERESSL